MNAQPDTLLQQTEQLSESVTRPIPGSRKVFVEGSRPDLRVAMREIVQTQTPTLFGGEENPPISVYDPSGPYTDPDARIAAKKQAFKAQSAPLATSSARPESLLQLQPCCSGAGWPILRKENRRSGLTALKRAWLPRSHVAPPHIAEPPDPCAFRRGRLAPRTRTYYLTHRCGTNRRVAGKQQPLSKTPHCEVRGFLF